MLNPRQRVAVEKRLAKIKSALAADKRKWGAWDDSRGLRYLSPGLFIKIEDWEGGLKYLKWFGRNFPDDIGMPEFLFEWAVILFKNNKLHEAERKIFETFISNTYLLDSFLGCPVIPIDKWEGSNLESSDYLRFFTYNRNSDFPDFSNWLEILVNSDEFQIMRDKFTDLNIKLKREKDAKIRGYLIAQIRQLEMSLISIT